MTRLPLTQLLAIQPTQGHLCNVCGSGHRTATPLPHPASSHASHAIPPRVLRFEASRHARIPSPSCWALGLGFEAQAKKSSSDGFVGKPPNPACSARPPAKPLDSTATLHQLDRPRPRLARLATMWPAPSPAIHLVPRTEPTCLSISRRPLKAEEPFAPVLHLQQHELGRSLHLRTEPRVSPTPIVNHSSLRSSHPPTTGTLLVLKSVNGQ
jgi:hypothetical protein